MTRGNTAGLTQLNRNLLLFNTQKETPMPGNLIYYAIVLIVVALLAAFFGFGGVASTAMGGAHLLIWVAVVVIVVGLALTLLRRA